MGSSILYGNREKKVIVDMEGKKQEMQERQG
jgi:hypothetical protein